MLNPLEKLIKRKEKAGPKENVAKTQLLKIFKKYNVLSTSISQDGSGASAGYPDVLGYTADGTHFVVECKRLKGGVLSKLQAKWRRDLEARGVIYFLFNGDESSVALLSHFLESPREW